MIDAQPNPAQQAQCSQSAERTSCFAIYACISNIHVRSNGQYSLCRSSADSSEGIQMPWRVFEATSANGKPHLIRFCPESISEKISSSELLYNVQWSLSIARCSRRLFGTAG